MQGRQNLPPWPEASVYQLQRETRRSEEQAEEGTHKKGPEHY